MRYSLLYIMLFCLLGSHMFGQNKPTTRFWVNEFSFSRPALSLVQVKDSSLVFKSRESMDLYEFRYTELDKVYYRKKGQAAKGLLIGTLVGGGIGAILGFSEGGDNSGIISFSGPQKALILGLGFGTIGGIVGVLFGSRTKRLSIYRRYDNFAYQKRKL